MRIIKGKDYYDVGMAYGIDPSLVFVRDNLIVDKTHPDFKALTSNYHNWNYGSTYHLSLIFCSKRYFVEMIKKIDSWEFSHINASSIPVPSKVDKVLQRNKWAIVYPDLTDTNRVIVNGSHLTDFKFQKIVPPMTAFQELEMWIGNNNTLNHDHDLIEISDEMKIAKHGMDKKSFRKEKENGKV